MANPLGDAPAGSDPLGDSPAGQNPLGDQPASRSNPLGDSPSTAEAPAPAEKKDPSLDDMVKAVQSSQHGQDWMDITKFALTHPLKFASGVIGATKAVAEAYPQASTEVKPGDPAFHIPRGDVNQPGVMGPVAGVANAADAAVESLTTPENLALITTGGALNAAKAAAPLAGLAARGLAGYFAVQSGVTAMKQAQTLGEVAGDIKSTPGQVAQAAGDVAASTTVGALAGKMALGDGTPASTEPLPTTQSTADALGYLDLNRTDALQKWIATDNPAKTIVTSRDAVDSATERAANTAANDVTHELSKNFNPDEMPDARKALGAVVESGGDPTVIQAWIDRLGGQKYNTTAQLETAHEYINAAQFALDNLDDLKDAATKQKAISDAVYQHAQDSGIEYPYRANYLLHDQDFETPAGFQEAMGGGTGAGTAFKKMRTFDVYPDSIAAGIAPNTLDAVDLLRASVRATQGAVNRNLWTDALSEMKDPTNQESIVVPRPQVTRPDGTTYFDTPAGYSPTDVGGRPMAIQNGYAGLFDAMNDPSKVNPTLSKINATGKSISLAIDTYHLGRLAFYQAASEMSRGEAPLPSYKHGLLIGDMPMSAIEDMAAKGDIDPSTIPRIREDKAIIDSVVNAGLNVGKIADSLHQEWVQRVPVLGDVNKFIFQQFQRGSIYDLAAKEFRYQQAERPDLSNDEISANVASDVNTRLGNLSRQGVLKGKTAQDLARLVFLAPQWNEALIRSEVGGVAQLGAAAGRAVKTGTFTPGMLGRVAGTLAIGQFAANQAINLYTRGKPTWENPEEGLGAKLSAWIPDKIGSSEGFFLNPTTLPFEISHLLEKSFERTSDWRDAVDQYVRGRLSTLARPVADIATKHDALGRPLTTAGTALDAIPAPIAGSAATAAGKQLLTGQHSEHFPGQFQKQAMATFGVRADQTPNAEQRMYALAADFKRQHNISSDAQYYSGDYQPLTMAIRMNNPTDTKQALDDILEKKTPQEIIHHYETAYKFPFTGSRRNEYQFYLTLSPEQKTTYLQAQQDRAAFAHKAVPVILQRVQADRAAVPATESEP